MQRLAFSAGVSQKTTLNQPSTTEQEWVLLGLKPTNFQCKPLGQVPSNP